MTPLEWALTVFVWGAVAAGALLTLVAVTLANGLIELTRARAENEKRLHGGER